MEKVHVNTGVNCADCIWACFGCTEREQEDGCKGEHYETLEEA